MMLKSIGKNKYFLSLAVSCACLSLIYARFVEPRWVKIKETRIEMIGKEPKKAGIRIAHLTDFHLSANVSLDYLRGVFREAANQRPDLICLTGDYITSELTQKAEYTDALKILSASAPTFACPGNHDGGLWAREKGGPANVDGIRSVLEGAGVVFLENATSKIEIRGVKIVIGGLGDIWAGRCAPEDIKNEMDTSKSDLRIILTHNPDSKIRVKDLKWDLILAGHTHGGQFYFPFVGTPFAPVADKRFVNGLYDYDGGKIYVSPGIGNIYGVRMNCRPEISILDIQK